MGLNSVYRTAGSSWGYVLGVPGRSGLLRGSFFTLLRLMKLFVLLAFVCTAQAQTGSVVVSTPLQVVPTAVVIPLRATSTGVAEIPGQSQAVNLKISPIQVTFPGQVSSPMNVVGFRLKGSSQGSWKATWTLDQPVTPFQVQAGRPLFLQFDFPIVGDWVLKWAPDLQTLSGVITPPSPTPDPQPAPPGASANCLKMPPATQLTDGIGRIWTPTPPTDQPVSSGQIGVKVNGVQVSASVDFLTMFGGIPYQFDNGWEFRSGDKWLAGTNPGCP